MTCGHEILRFAQNDNESHELREFSELGQDLAPFGGQSDKLKPVLLFPDAFADVAVEAEGLEVGGDCLAAAGEGLYVVDCEDDASFYGG